MDVLGADRLVRVFGHWPSFHDAEVLRFVLDRGEALGEGPTVLAELHVFEMTNEVGGDGSYVLRNHTLVRFRFVGVDDLMVKGFNHQNAIWDLVMQDIAERQLERVKWDVTFAGSFGVEAHFVCREILVEDVQPFGPRMREAG